MSYGKRPRLSGPVKEHIRRRAHALSFDYALRIEAELTRMAYHLSSQGATGMDIRNALDQA